MANEITISANLSFSKGLVEPASKAISLSVTVSGTDYVKMTQTIGFAAAEAINLGDITTPGYILISNLDTTNYVTLRDGAGGADVVKLKAGEAALFRVGASALYALANTAACVVEYLLIEA